MFSAVWAVLKVHRYDTTGCQTGCQSGLTTGCLVSTNIQPGCTTGLTTGCMFVYMMQPVVQPAVHFNSRLSNRFDIRLNVCIHDTTCCQTDLTTTRLTTGCIVLQTTCFFKFRFLKAFYSARNARIASAVLAMAIPSVCPSVRLSHAGIVSKRRHVARCSLHRWIAKCVLFCRNQKIFPRDDHFPLKFWRQVTYPRYMDGHHDGHSTPWWTQAPPLRKNENKFPKLMDGSRWHLVWR